MKEEMAHTSRNRTPWCFYFKNLEPTLRVFTQKKRTGDCFSKAIYGNPRKKGKNTEKSNPNIGTKSNLVHPFEVFTASDITSILFRQSLGPLGPPGWMTGRVGGFRCRCRCRTGATGNKCDLRWRELSASWARAERELRGGPFFLDPEMGPKW